ncbi:hypothetical protein FNV43_RR08380 [Rhamnella rubrinervis]|uniref:Secreted protein n=1 Tax=Rhamnella rubrinervis TaxID=2594499 RepID=A0A8K0H840_9ROSA|nr:hypothetical protein FNV43_RR08380 [Rhamnella rubrinervis]
MQQLVMIVLVGVALRIVFLNKVPCLGNFLGTSRNAVYGCAPLKLDCNKQCPLLKVIFSCNGHAPLEAKEAFGGKKNNDRCLYF